MIGFHLPDHAAGGQALAFSINSAMSSSTGTTLSAFSEFGIEHDALDAEVGISLHQVQVPFAGTTR